MTFLLHFLHSVGLGDSFKPNVIQILVGPHLKPNSHFLWSNPVKAILAEFGFERLRIFQDKSLRGMIVLK